MGRVSPIIPINEPSLEGVQRTAIFHRPPRQVLHKLGHERHLAPAADQRRHVAKRRHRIVAVLDDLRASQEIVRAGPWQLLRLKIWIPGIHLHPQFGQHPCQERKAWTTTVIATVRPGWHNSKQFIDKVGKVDSRLRVVRIIMLLIAFTFFFEGHMARFGHMNQATPQTVPERSLVIIRIWPRAWTMQTQASWKWKVTLIQEKLLILL
mmetsp:Transcript_105065/g.197911  ORF Transcript_105065/g.197911 Transcript_105065/m.197911 type:complete len:208 (+) Transcript_105065:62-685(+)